MATTLQQINALLQAEGLNYTVIQDPEHPHISLSYRTHWHKDASGDSDVSLDLSLVNEGECMYFLAPGAFTVGEGNLGVASFVAGVIQRQTHYVQFEFSRDSHEILPCIELPLADAELTQKQLALCINSLVDVVDRYTDVLKLACEKGEIDFDLYHAEDGDDRTVDQLSAMLSEFTPDLIAAAVAASQRRR